MSLPGRLTLVAVFVLAATARFAVLFAHGAPLDAASYDESVYYAAAAALVHGRFPYHGDFVFVHPPVIALIGTPFAALARMTTDTVGFAAENVAFAVIGAVNAVLVVVVARAWALGRGAWAAGFVYAMWPVGFAAESTARLEPVGNLFFLLFLWAFGRGRGGDSRPLVLAGVSLAVLVNTKVWWCVPVLVLMVLVAVIARSVRVVAVPAAAAALTAVILDLPFLLVAGPRMFRSIVMAQLHRPETQWTTGGHFVRLSAGERLEQLTGAPQAVAGLLGHAPTSHDAPTALVVAVVAGFVATAALACRSTTGRIFAAILVAQAAVLFAAPVYYPFYGDYLAVMSALVIAAAASHTAPHRKAVAPWGWAIVAVLACALTLNGLGGPAGPVTWSALRAEAAGVPCLVSDSPYVLIRLDALDRSFEPGCRNVVDFQGVSYGAGPDARARAAGRSATPEYKRFVTEYLTSGDAVALSGFFLRVRLGSAAMRAINRGPLIARSGKVRLRRTAGLDATNGSDVPERGRVPSEFRQAYAAAH